MKYSGVDVLLAGLFLSLAVVFPIIFHAIGLGSAFLPMFYPIVVAGFIIKLPLALVVGMISPLLSAIWTGMPPFFPPIVFIMMAEGLVLTVIPYLLHQKYRFNILLTFIITVIIDRLIVLGAVLIISKWLELPEEIFGIISVVNGLPGIVVMLIVVPPLVNRFTRKKKQIAVME